MVDKMWITFLGPRIAPARGSIQGWWITFGGVGSSGSTYPFLAKKLSTTYPPLYPPLYPPAQ